MIRDTPQFRDQEFGSSAVCVGLFGAALDDGSVTSLFDGNV